MRKCGNCNREEFVDIDPLPQEEQVLKVLSWTNVVHRNEDAMVTIQGKPGVEYDIDVYYSSGISKAEGLENKNADDDGFVTWVWHVGGKTKAGTYKIVITGGGETLTFEFTVTVE